ncbi:putative phosphatase [Thaumarchaeota archaeon SCGC AB-539-E09]|nr:putative phosphatase [Thaumarchaeota archaeon SCGC AB-539-E09]
MELEGVVFDLDATLVNMGGFVDWREAHRRVLEAYLSTDCPKYLIERCSEKGLFNMLNLIRDEISLTMPESKVEKIQEKAYSAIESCEIKSVKVCQLMPSCDQVLDWLMRWGIKMSVATSNSQTIAEEILNSKNISHYFSAVVGRSPQLKMKPYPDQILRCFDLMGVDPSNGIVVGDSVKDVLAAKKVGIYVVAIPAYFTKRDTIEKAGADVIIESLAELPNIFSRFV